MRGMKLFTAACLALLCVASRASAVPPNDTPRSWDAIVEEPYGAHLGLVCDAAINKLENQGYLVTARRQANWTIPPAVKLSNWKYDLYVGYGVWVDNTHGSSSGLAAEGYELSNAGLVARNNAMVAYAKAGYDTLNVIYASQSEGGYHISMYPVFLASNFYNWRTLVVNGACSGYTYAQSWRNARVVESYDKVITNAQVMLDMDNLFSRLDGDYGVELRTVEKADDQTQMTKYGEGKTVLSPRIVFDNVPTTLSSRQRGVQINFDTPIDTEIRPTTALANRSTNLEIYPYWYTDGLGFTLIGRATGSGMLEAVAGDILNFRDGIQSTGHIGLDANGLGPNRDGKLFPINCTYVDTDPASSITNYQVMRDAADVVVSWRATQEEQTSAYRIEYSPNWFGARLPVVEDVGAGAGTYRVVIPHGADGIYWLQEVEHDGTVVDHEGNPVDLPSAVQADTIIVTTADFRRADSLLAVTRASRNQLVQSAQQYDIFTVRRFACPATWLANAWNSWGLPTQVVYLEDIGGAAGIKPFVTAHTEITSALLYGSASVLRDVNGNDVWNDPTQWNTMGYGPKLNMPQNINNAVIGLYYTADPDSQQVGFPFWTRSWGSVLQYFDRNNNGSPDDSLIFGVAPVADTTDAWGFNFKTANAKYMQASSWVSFWGYFRGGTNAAWNYSMALQDSLKRRLPSGIHSTTLRDWFLAPMSVQQRLTQSVAEMNAGRSLVVSNSIYDNWLGIGGFLPVDHNFTMAMLQSNPGHPTAIFSQCGVNAYDLVDSLGAVLSVRLINTPDKGAYLIWAPNRGSFAQANFALQDTALALIYQSAGGPYPLTERPFGSVANEASCAVINRYPAYADVVRSYILLGDPNLPIKVPGPTLVDVPNIDPTVSFHISPNPVVRGPSTIHFALAASCQVDLAVYDITGRRVAQLLSGQQSAGDHTITFNSGQLPAGVYLVRLRTPDFERVAKIVGLR